MKVIDCVNNAEIQTEGISRRGTLRATYARLVDTFGPPTFPTGDGYDADVRWVLRLSGRVVTIQNDEDGPCHLGREGSSANLIGIWQVGGFHHEVVNLVRGALVFRRRQRYYQRNRDKRIAYARAWAAANPERARENQRKARANDSARYNGYATAYRERNRELIRLRARLVRAAQYHESQGGR